MSEDDWTEDREIEEAQKQINDWRALNKETFYRRDNSANKREFRQHCEGFIEEAEKELVRFKVLVEAITPEERSKPETETQDPTLSQIQVGEPQR